MSLRELRLYYNLNIKSIKIFPSTFYQVELITFPSPDAEGSGFLIFLKVFLVGGEIEEESPFIFSWLTPELWPVGPFADRSLLFRFGGATGPFWAPTVSF